MSSMKELIGYPNLNKNFEDFVLIGRGGFGEVYSGTYKKSGKRYAIKVLLNSPDRPETAKLRFENECKLLAKIKSPYVVGFFGHFVSDNEAYYAMELINGNGLKNIILKNKKLLPETAVSYAKEICQGLIEIHKMGVVHRDLKPSNILIDSKSNTIKLIDFGISLDETSKRVTSTNKTVGSIQYIAPEILTRSSDATLKSDIYALGIILYEMLVGKVPFTSQDPQQIMLMQINEPLPKIEGVNIIIPQPLENIIIRCTAKNPEQRYENCSQLYLDLLSCLKPDRASEPRLELNMNKKVAKAKKFFKSKTFAILYFTLGGILILVAILLIGFHAGGIF